MSDRKYLFSAFVKGIYFMRKRFVALLLAFCFVCVCSLSAFASDGFNIDVIKNAQDIYIMEDEMEGNTTFTLSSLLVNNPDIYDFDDVAIIFCPGILTFDDIDAELFVFEAIIISFQPVNFEKVIFKIGDTRYDFSNVIYADVPPSSNIIPFQSQLGLHMTLVMIPLEPHSLTVVDDLVQNRDIPAKVRFKVDDFKHYDITMSQKIMDGTVHLYNLFAQAGGLSEDAINKMNQICQRSPNIFPTLEISN